VRWVFDKSLAGSATELSVVARAIPVT